MPRRPPVALSGLIAMSPDPNFDAAVVLAVALGACAAHMVSEDVGAPLPAVWSSLRRMIEAGYIDHLTRLGMLMVSRKGQAVARSVYDVHTFAYIPPVPPQSAPELGGAA
ncbi:putative transcriptional regulator [Xanthobacter sp. SG618]|uniref:hypothetical protein n=1 Tax=Xanthobacter sp. SG618 TaxID=2587121 RepID=UPI00145F4680|nr:hypothetical protein [Xanthobacter sp. SG618]NMN57839.1 putative transcriptional regulator [Xanthobacter sp. SG618]